MNFFLSRARLVIRGRDNLQFAGLGDVHFGEVLDFQHPDPPAVPFLHPEGFLPLFDDGVRKVFFLPVPGRLPEGLDRLGFGEELFFFGVALPGDGDRDDREPEAEEGKGSGRRRLLPEEGGLLREGEAVAGAFEEEGGRLPQPPARRERAFSAPSGR